MRSPRLLTGWIYISCRENDFWIDFDGFGVVFVVESDFKVGFWWLYLGFRFCVVFGFRFCILGSICNSNPKPKATQNQHFAARLQKQIWNLYFAWQTALKLLNSFQNSSNLISFVCFLNFVFPTFVSNAIVTSATGASAPFTIEGSKVIIDERAVETIEELAGCDFFYVLWMNLFFRSWIYCCLLLSILE